MIMASGRTTISTATFGCRTIRTLGYVLLKRHEYSLAVAELKHADELLKTQTMKDTQLAQAIHAHLLEASKSAGQLMPE